ncbi:MAG: MFS transporter [Gaiellales bacterium]
MTPSLEPVPIAAIRWHRGAASVLVSVLALGTTVGIGYPLYSLYLSTHGASSAAVAISGAMTSIGMVVSAPLLPVLVRRFGLWGLLVGTLVVMVATLAAIAAWRSELAWFPLRLLLGATINGVFVCSETWLNQAAPEHLRGRVLGAYATTLSAGIILGPLLIAALGTRSIAPFLVAVAIAALAIVPVMLARRDEPPLVRTDVEPFSLGRFRRHVGALLGAVLALAFFSASVLSLLPVYLGARGASDRAAALSVAALTLGSLVAQPPIGWLADHFDRHRILLMCAAAAGLGGLVLPLLGPSGVLLWIVVFAWGAFAYAVYPLGLGVLGSSLTPGQLVSANAVWSFVWGTGGVVGLPATGAAMSLFGPQALPLTLAVVWALALVWLVAARRRGAVQPGARWTRRGIA